MLPAWLSSDARVVHTDRVPGAPGEPVPWPVWAPADLVHRAQGQGIAQPWGHQVQAAEAFRSGRHVALSTGTSSGKSLAYLLPIIEATGAPQSRAAPGLTVPPADLAHPRLPGLGLEHARELDDAADDDAREPGEGERPDLADLAAAARFRRTTALYLAPTKALAHDQLRNAWPLGPHGWRVAALDGDSERDERRFARDYATLVLTNPDMLHASVLPSHTAWSSFLGGLRYVVVDEAHRYRGVFGAHVALVLRRLRRLCARYGAAPTFLCSSATTVDAAEMMGRLIGEPSDQIVTVSADGSPRGARDIVFWQPWDSTEADVAMLLGRFVAEGKQTLAFVASRRAAEHVARQARSLAGAAPGSAPGMRETIASYRGGYLPRERRAIEAELQSGALRGVATTNALELGVDIAGVDAVVIGGYPGSVASLWQQAGRAGRRGADATVVLVARNDPLDAYLLDHPEHLLRAPVEPTVFHPDNPAILAPHLGAAAQELPLTEDDARWFGPTMRPLLDRLSGHGTLRRRRSGWYWPHLGRAVDGISIRSTGGQPIELIEEATGRILGTVDPASADRVAHPGAVYLHQGEHWLVTELDHEQHEALVEAAPVDYDTLPLTESEVCVRSARVWRPLGLGEVHRGTVDVSSRVLAYLRRDLDTGHVIERVPLDLPARTLQTHATWFTLPAPACPSVRLRGGAHAAEHVLVSLIASVAGSDRTDVAGAFSISHPDTSMVTVFVYDTAPGGAGFAAAGFDHADTWLANALDRLTQCGCDSGCPRCCIVSGCPVANDDVDKATALAILRAWDAGSHGTTTPGRSRLEPEHSPVQARARSVLSEP